MFRSVSAGDNLSRTGGRLLTPEKVAVKLTPLSPRQRQEWQRPWTSSRNTPTQKPRTLSPIRVKKPKQKGNLQKLAKQKEKPPKTDRNVVSSGNTINLLGWNNSKSISLPTSEKMNLQLAREKFAAAQANSLLHDEFHSSAVSSGSRILPESSSSVPNEIYLPPATPVLDVTDEPFRVHPKFFEKKTNGNKTWTLRGGNIELDMEGYGSRILLSKSESSLLQKTLPWKTNAKMPIMRPNPEKMKAMAGAYAKMLSHPKLERAAKKKIQVPLATGASRY